MCIICRFTVDPKPIPEIQGKDVSEEMNVSCVLYGKVHECEGLIFKCLKCAIQNIEYMPVHTNC